jgi:hypothetical protein
MRRKARLRGKVSCILIMGKRQDVHTETGRRASDVTPATAPSILFLTSDSLPRHDERVARLHQHTPYSTHYIGLNKIETNFTHRSQRLCLTFFCGRIEQAEDLTTLASLPAPPLI